MFEYDAKLVRVIDGDTIEVIIDLGFSIFHKVKLRLLDIDTPEIFHPLNEAEKIRGLEARDFVKYKLESAKKLTVRTRKTGKYGRWLAYVYIDDICLNDLLKIKGFQK